MTRLPRRRRLDAELVRRGMARSREQAVELIDGGNVTVAGHRASKGATQVETGAAIVVDTGESGPGYASRGGHKLAGALTAFTDLTLRGRRCLDAGAAAGGFCDVLLRAGAAHVVAVDVGYGQLAWSLRNDERVTVLERTNVRHLDPSRVGEPVGLVVADLSFISLALVLPTLAGCALPEADFVLLVKPQFEVGREKLGAGGVVRQPDLRSEAVRQVAASAAALGIGVRGLCVSPLRGPAGNVEYFLWLRRGAPELSRARLDQVMAEEPR